MWHEMLHSASGSYNGKEGQRKHGIIEEASVELLTQEICKEQGIRYQKAYGDYVEILDQMCNYLGYNRMAFAKELYNQDLPDRYDWFEDQVRKNCRVTMLR